MSLEAIKETINNYFRYDKLSEIGNCDKIRGRVVHPSMGIGVEPLDNNR